MANNNILTDIEKNQLYDALKYKMNDPELSFHDIYSGINSISPSYGKEVAIGSTICGLICLISLVVIVCFDKKSNPYVFGLIGYVTGSSIECYVLYKYQKMWYLVLALLVILLIIVLNRDIDLNILKEWISPIMSICT